MSAKCKLSGLSFMFKNICSVLFISDKFPNISLLLARVYIMFLKTALQAL